MKKVLTLAAFASVIALPAFAQSFDPDLGTGNLVPPVANTGAASTYARHPPITKGNMSGIVTHTDLALLVR